MFDNSDSAVSLLKDLIAIPSVNPTDKEVIEGIYGDDSIAEYISHWFRKRSLDVEIQNVSDGCHNVVVHIPGKNRNKCTVFCAHMDTVDIENMKIDPFDPKEIDGRIFGRGSCDDKASLSAMMVAFHAIADNQAPENDLVFLASGGEEFNMRGAEYFINNNSYNIDGVIVGEPTNLRLISAHKGGIRQEIITRGVSAHSSTPELGVNPIYKMAKIINLIEDYSNQLMNSAPHPLLKTETIVCSIVNAGKLSNTIPDECRSVVDWRIHPGKKEKACKEKLYNFLKMNTDADFEFGKTIFTSPMETASDNCMVRKMLKENWKYVSQESPEGATYGTDGSKFYLNNIPAVVIGPGDIAQAHTKDEFVEITQIEKAIEIYKSYISNL